VADVFDALTSRRPYKEPFSNEKSFAILKEAKGSHFELQLIDIFFDRIDEIMAIQKKYMDISLPGMDGLTAAKIIKADDLTKKIPIIAMTAHAMKGYEDRAMEAGCNSYITKPINTKTFSSTISGFIGQ